MNEEFEKKLKQIINFRLPQRPRVKFTDTKKEEASIVFRIFENKTPLKIHAPPNSNILTNPGHFTSLLQEIQKNEKEFRFFRQLLSLGDLDFMRNLNETQLGMDKSQQQILFEETAKYPANLIIIRTNFGKVIGGYITKPWREGRIGLKNSGFAFYICKE